MRTSTLELVLETERVRHQAAMTGAGFAIPALYQYPVEEPVDAPFLVTSARGTFLLVPSKYGVVRLSFFECPFEREAWLLGELYRVLWGISVRRQWFNRCSSVAEAVDQMKKSGIKPASIVVSLSFLEDACGTPLTLEDAEEIMFAQGCVTEFDGLKVFAADLPAGGAFVATSPSVVGTYFRVDQHLGVLLRRVDRSLVLVG